MVRVSLLKEDTFEPDTNDEEEPMTRRWKKGFICRQNDKCKDPEVGTRLGHARTEERPVYLELSGPEGEQCGTRLWR